MWSQAQRHRHAGQELQKLMRFESLPCHASHKPASHQPQAWEHGLHRIFNRSVEDEGGAEFEEYTRALPTITVGNIVPEVNPRLGATHMTIA